MRCRPVESEHLHEEAAFAAITTSSSRAVTPPRSLGRGVVSFACRNANFTDYPVRNAGLRLGSAAAQYRSSKCRVLSPGGVLATSTSGRAYRCGPLWQSPEIRLIGELSVRSGRHRGLLVHVGQVALCSTDIAQLSHCARSADTLRRAALSSRIRSSSRTHDAPEIHYD